MVGERRPHRHCVAAPPILVGISAVVGPEKLIANERIGIATDDPVARDHIGRTDADARTESVIGVCLSIIGGDTGFMSPRVGCGNGMMLARVTGRVGGLGRDRERREHADETYPNRVPRCHFHLFRSCGRQVRCDAFDNPDMWPRSRSGLRRIAVTADVLRRLRALGGSPPSGGACAERPWQRTGGPWGRWAGRRYARWGGESGSPKGS